MKFFIKKCLHCQEEFDAPIKEHNRGNAKFCSISCSSKFKNSNRDKQEPNVICSYCEQSFYKNKSKQKNSKSGHFFCSRICKDSAQRIYGNKLPILSIMPQHYGVLTDYRCLAFSSFDIKCNECNWDKIPEILEVHHIDGNRKNNDISNLRMLCPTCHRTQHFIEKSGPYTQSNKKIGGP